MNNIVLYREIHKKSQLYKNNNNKKNQCFCEQKYYSIIVFIIQNLKW